MIADGRVAIDGKVLDTPAVKLESLRGVTVDGKPVGKPEDTRLFAFHKPSGLITAERDPKGTSDDLCSAAQCAAQGCRPRDAGRPPRLQHRGPAAAYQ